MPAETQARRAEREARFAGQRRDVRNRTVAIVGAVVALVVACVALYSSPLFAVTRVEVVGNTRVTAGEVLAAARVPRGATLIRFPSSEVAARVARLPWVGQVTVARLFPNGMQIRIVERAPEALIDTGKVFWLVDRGGTVIARPSGSETAGLVVIRDVPGLDPIPGRRLTAAPLINALTVLHGLSPQLSSKVRVVSAPSVDGTTLYTDERIEIVIGSAAELARKDWLVRQILAQQHGKVVSIDVRTTDRPTWRGLAK